jgi:hypothetical protein
MLAEMLTPATSPRSDPWSVTIVPPAMGPDIGLIEDTTGAVNVNVGPEPEPVEIVVTTAGPTVLVPTGAIPASQSMCDALRQVNGAQATPASVTVETSEADAPSPVPAITTVLPSIRPCITGDIDVTLGAAAYVKVTDPDPPCTVEIETGTEPAAVELGVETTTCELDIHATIDTLAPATSTWVTWVDTAPKKDPAKVTGTPPPSGTTDGVTEVRTGPRKGVVTVVLTDIGDIPSDVLNRSV